MDRNQRGQCARVEQSIRRFGFTSAGLTTDRFLNTGNIVRIGIPSLRIEILTSIDGGKFEDCYLERELTEIDGLLIPVISLEHLRQNKAASGRPKDLADLNSLPK